MIEHETHSVPVAVDAGDAAAERLHQVIEGREQDIGQDGPFQMAPEAFNQIQSWWGLANFGDSESAVFGRETVFSWNSAMSHTAVCLEALARTCGFPREFVTFSNATGPELAKLHSWTVRRQPVDRQLLRMSGRHGGNMLGSPWHEV